jgi:hypothetical protein
MKIFILLTILFIVSIAVSANAADKKPASDGQHSDGGGWGSKVITSGDPKLPRVLLIGDSIANGYSKAVGEKLKGKANVDLWITPEHVASKGIGEKVTKACTAHEYAVIHFNESGLHAWSKGRVPDGQYEPLLRKYVEAIQAAAPKAKLIWCSTTPSTIQGKPGVADEELNKLLNERNDMGRKIMGEKKIAIDDLWNLMIDKLNLMRGDRWHWKKEGSDLQAEAVTKSIADALR